MASAVQALEQVHAILKRTADSGCAVAIGQIGQYQRQIEFGHLSCEGL
jgi:hypothetical protein